VNATASATDPGRRYLTGGEARALGQMVGRHMGTLNRRRPRGGEEPLRRALSGLLDCRPEDIAVTPGIRAIALAAHTWARSVLIERPTFRAVVDVLRQQGLAVRSARWPEILRPAVCRANAELVRLTSPARNPDGATLRGHEVTAVAALTAGRTVICNETCRWWSAQEALPPRVIRVGSLHKLVGGGVRIGWIRLSTATEPQGLKDLGYASAPSPWQLGVADFIAEGLLSDVISRLVRQARLVREAFVAEAGPALVAGPDVPDVPHLLLQPGTAGDSDPPFRESGCAGRGDEFAAPGCWRISFLELTADEAALVGREMKRAHDANAQVWETDPRKHGQTKGIQG
jgi:DNA-binding transcriptional MocR family regulator